MTYQKVQDDPQITEAVNSQYAEGTASESVLPKKPPALLGLRGVGLGLILGLGVSFLGSKLLSQPASEPTAATAAVSSNAAAISVTVQQLQTAGIQQSLQATGTVQAFDLLQIAPQVSGLQIREVRVRVGDQVSAGQVLAVLDDSVLRTQLVQAQANYAQAEAQVLQERAEQAQAEANAAAAQDDFERNQTLFDKGGISLQELNGTRTQAITAREAVGVAKAAVQSAQATVNSRDAEVKQLETQLAQTIITAPTNGQIAERQATIGDTSSAVTPLFSMVQDGLLKLVVDLPQSQLSAVQPGMPVKVTSSTNDQIKLSATVRSIDPSINQQTRQAAVNVSLPPDANLRIGMFLQAEFMTGQRSGTVLPATAVLPQADNSFRVFTVNEAGTAELVSVTVGERLPATAGQPERLEILSGLNESDRVIVEGASYLQPGDLVFVVPSPFTETPEEAPQPIVQPAPAE